MSLPVPAETRCVFISFLHTDCFKAVFAHGFCAGPNVFFSTSPRIILNKNNYCFLKPVRKVQALLHIKDRIRNTMGVKGRKKPVGCPPETGTLIAGGILKAFHIAAARLIPLFKASRFYGSIRIQPKYFPISGFLPGPVFPEVSQKIIPFAVLGKIDTVVTLVTFPVIL